MSAGVARAGVRSASRGGKGRELTARCGLTARGVLYLLIAGVAARVALGDTAQEADRQGALKELSGQPFGGVLVGAVGVGLVCMALWRLSEAVFGAAGADGGKATKRLASAARTVFYGTAAYSVLSFAAGAGSGPSSDEQSRDVTTKALGLPAGQWLVGAAGAGILVAGVVIGVKAARRSFRKHMEMGGVSAGLRKTVDVLGVGGGMARGLVFATAGGFAVYAAVRYDPAQVKGMDDTLRSFTGTPAGPWLLLAVAAGLALFGLFSFAMARWRKV
ncbi:DUF1206 domain-containing protein [Streptomyces sp. NPDC101733]|uniref:DUF1206 domain-containing protein n=1 Tax=unclassified Streptomyces TaxID=2593676 RepID=UPI0037FDE725